MSTTDTVPPPAQDRAATPRRSRRLLIIVGVLVVALGAAGYLFVLRGEPAPAAAEAAAEPAAVEEGPVVEVGTLTTNLAGASGRYARVGVALVLRADVDVVTVEERFALVKDAAITEIGRHEAAALQSPGGTEALRAGLAERIAEVYPDGAVVRVVLTELLVQ